MSSECTDKTKIKDADNVSLAYYFRTYSLLMDDIAEEISRRGFNIWVYSSYSADRNCSYKPHTNTYRIYKNRSEDL